MTGRDGGRAVLWAKLAYTAVELALGVALLVAAVTHHDVTSFLRAAAHRELREDPTDFAARHVLSFAHPIPRRREAVAGLAVAVYAMAKAALVVTILRGSRRAVVIGAVVFGVIAAVALVAVLHHPTPLRVLAGALDVAVAAVVLREARPVTARAS